MNLLVNLLNMLKGSLAKMIGSFLPTIVTRRFDNKAKAIAKREQIHRERPELKITKYSNYLARENNYGINVKSDLDVLMSFYQEAGVEENDYKRGIVYPIYEVDYQNKKDWRCVLYRLKNVGKTAISSFGVISRSKKDLCIFEAEAAANLKGMLERLNYYVLCDRKIYPEESFTLKLCYNKDMVLCYNFSATLYIGMEDDNGRRWIQPLFAPKEKIYDSRYITYENYRALCSTDLTEKMKREELNRIHKRAQKAAKTS